METLEEDAAEDLTEVTTLARSVVAIGLAEHEQLCIIYMQIILKQLNFFFFCEVQRRSQWKRPLPTVVALSFAMFAQTVAEITP